MRSKKLEIVLVADARNVETGVSNSRETAVMPKRIFYVLKLTTLRTISEMCIYGTPYSHWEWYFIT